MPTDRTLDLSVYVVGQQFMSGEFQAQPAYIETASNPPSPGLLNNFRTGNIDFSTLAPDPNFTWNVDITFTLVPFIFDKNGRPVRACWATPITKAITITPSSPEMTASFVGDPSSPMKILLDDNDNDGNLYTYKLTFMLPDYGPYYISLDPQIVNKAGGGGK